MLESALPYLSLPTLTLALLSVSLLGVSSLQSYLRLYHVPGPAVAAWTDLWRFLDVWGGRAETTHLHLHHQYGDVVRLGPNCVSISMPGVIDSIYGISKGFVKSDFYKVWHNVVNGRRVPSPVFELDEKKHAQQKRPIAPSFQLSKLIEFESSVDSTTAAFFTRLDQLAASREALDFGSWLQYYSFDVIGELTFSRRLGFLERGSDVEGVIGSISRNFDRNSVLGQMPWLDLITFKTPIYTRLLSPAIVSPIMAFGNRRMLERVDPGVKLDDTQDINVTDPDLQTKVTKASELAQHDFLSRFLASRETHPDVVDEKQILAYLFMNVNAGSDTISTTLRAIFYYLLKHPSTLERIRSELDTAVAEGKISPVFVTWAESNSLPYLHSVILEALRIHPPISLSLERVVPSGGLQLPNGMYLPPGTVVGINPWVLHRDERIFGADASSWRPERWLDQDIEVVKTMERNLLSFGAGKRSCLGKNIAMLELHKIVSALLLRYDFQLVNPGMEWKLKNSWVISQKGLDMFIFRRQPKGESYQVTMGS